MAEPIALTALALDAAFGWPRALYRRLGHPVRLFAHIIGNCEARWNTSAHSFGVRRVLGALTLLILLVLVVGAGWALQHLLLASLGGWGWIAIAHSRSAACLIMSARSASGSIPATSSAPEPRSV